MLLRIIMVICLRKVGFIHLVNEELTKKIDPDWYQYKIIMAINYVD